MYSSKSALISLYSYIRETSVYPIHRTVNNLSFNEFVRYSFANKIFLDTNYVRQIDWIYNDDGTKLINRIIKFENLNGELKYLLLSQGVAKDRLDELNWTPYNSSKHNPDIKSYYTNGLLDYIHSNKPEFISDLKTLGYPLLKIN